MSVTYNVLVYHKTVLISEKKNNLTPFNALSHRGSTYPIKTKSPWKEVFVELVKTLAGLFNNKDGVIMNTRFSLFK